MMKTYIIIVNKIYEMLIKLTNTYIFRQSLINPNGFL